VVRKNQMRRCCRCAVTCSRSSGLDFSRWRSDWPLSCDCVFSAEVDTGVNGFGLKGLKTPARSPMANAHCERVVGTIRRECLDYLIPLNAQHLRRTVREFAFHYNRGRPHSALGPGFPEPTKAPVRLPPVVAGIDCPPGYRVARSTVLGGLHDEYRLEEEVA
jgi:transposase InsO family protein